MATIDRNKKLAEIKASIELLEECKEKVLSNNKLDEATKKDRTEQIDEAIKENYEKAKLQFQASKGEIDSATYNEVSEEYKAKYAERLKKKGITDEQLHQKEQAVAISAVGDETTIRKRHRRTKRTEQLDDENGFDPNKIKRLPNEEELMNKSLVKSNKEFERRRHRSSNTASDVSLNELKDTEAIGTVIENKKVKPREESSVVITVDGKNNGVKESLRVTGETESKYVEYNFDASQIPSYIQYDVLPLPSNGECYAHKKSRIPVAYMTAADENIIASPNMYRDGKIIDLMLERKILDKEIKVDELCKGDRDAIVLWLRATGYGSDFPIIARHPETNKEYPVNVKLDTFKYYPFNLHGDENGYFEYTTERGDIIKFKYLNVREEEELKNDLIARATNIEKYNTIKYINNLSKSIAEMNIDEADRRELSDCIADMKDIINTDDLNIDTDSLYTYSITNQMIKYTMSVNGNTDKEFIKNYIENMRSRDAFAYRTYVSDNTPGVNMKITVNVPQSDGGGTFNTFLGIDDYVFGNI